MAIIQSKFSLEDEQAEFVSQFSDYGFKDKSELVRTALMLLKQRLLEQQLIESAELYAEVYAEDKELQELADSAVEGWPE